MLESFLGFLFSIGALMGFLALMFFIVSCVIDGYNLVLKVYHDFYPNNIIPAKYFNYKELGLSENSKFCLYVVDTNTGKWYRWNMATDEHIKVSYVKDMKEVLDFYNEVKMRVS